MGTRPTDRRRRYRRLMYGAVAVGTLGFVAGSELGRPLAGLAVYWLGALTFVGVWWGTDVTLFDERDRALERRAGKLTLCGLGVVFVLGVSALVVLEELEGYAAPAELQGAILGYAALYLAFGAVYFGLRLRDRA
mgnify:CR=1 FL=1